MFVARIIERAVAELVGVEDVAYKDQRRAGEFCGLYQFCNR